MPRAQHFIDGSWITGDGPEMMWESPADGRPTWRGHAASIEQIDSAITAARKAFAFWNRRPLSERITYLETFANELQERKRDLVDTISHETGKPNWEAASEVDTMIRKIPLSIAAYRERRSPTETESGGELSATRYKPHGVVAVFGPFNFPGHLPNGHIVPALLAGNTVVFKPSEQAPLVADMTLRAWEAADIPPGVINCVQGGRDVGAALASHPGLGGIFFTGSFAAGKSLSQTLANAPGKILALEMGGNNPLVVWQAKDRDAAAYFTLLSAFITAGQRCSCARRLIVQTGKDGDAFLDTLAASARKLKVGVPTDRPEPFMGTVISQAAADRIVTAYDDLLQRGGVPLLRMQRLSTTAALLSPGILDVTAVQDRADAEVFGPLLQVIRVARLGRSDSRSQQYRLRSMRRAPQRRSGALRTLLRIRESRADQLEPAHHRREQRASLWRHRKQRQPSPQWIMGGRLLLVSDRITRVAQPAIASAAPDRNGWHVRRRVRTDVRIRSQLRRPRRPDASLCRPGSGETSHRNDSSTPLQVPSARRLRAWLK